MKQDTENKNLIDALIAAARYIIRLETAQAGKKPRDLADAKAKYQLAAENILAQYGEKR